MTEPYLIPNSEACRMLRCSDRTLRTWIKKGHITIKGRVGREKAFEYWDIVRIIGIKGRGSDAVKKLLDSRKDSSKLQEVGLDQD